MALVLPVLRQAGWLVGKIVLNLNFLKIIYQMKYLTFHQGTLLLLSYQCILANFLHNAYSKVDFGHSKILDAIFLGQSLILSTTVLNDTIN